MANNYQQPGIILQYKASSEKNSGDVVVIGNILGVALTDIPKDDTGSVQIEGVFEVPKVSGNAISQGESLVYDVSESAFDAHDTTQSAGDISGPPAVAFEDAKDDATKVMVRFTGVPGTVESA